ARAQQPHVASLERHGGENEPRRDGGEHETSQAQIEERNEGDVEKADRLAAMQRQGLDVEQIHDHQHREENELAPLRRVAEEQLHVLDHELALRHGEEGEHDAYGATPRSEEHTSE